MELAYQDEPELQFADGRHIDVRAGIASYGVLDRRADGVPRPIRVGVLGTRETVSGLSEWLNASEAGVASKERRLVDLRPDFPGVTEQVFGTSLELSSRCTRELASREIERCLESSEAATQIVDLWFENARDLTRDNAIDVLVVAPPAEVFALTDPGPLSPRGGGEDSPSMPVFHDVFKARALGLSVPCQFVRPDTYGGKKTPTARRGTLPLQDEATRAWNFHTALYYKAGGVPWRLVRDPTAFATCYLGLAFFYAADRKSVLTSVAQVFDERGEGVVVQGGEARVDKQDRTVHLPQGAIEELIAKALKAYRREHRHAPARLVVHKSSAFDQGEITGAQSAADAAQVDMVELLSLRRSGVRLFRTGVYPVLRGTALAFDSKSGLVYLRGSVPQFQTYPGMYVPSALEFTQAAGEDNPMAIARELLELSKLNFNSTQFDGGLPITLRAAKRVGDILKHVTASNESVENRFRYFT